MVGAGEPFRLYYRIKNYGTGGSGRLSATLADLDGAFILVDSVDTCLDIAPFAEGENLFGFYMTEVDTTTEHRLRIEITDAYARAFIDTIELRPPDPPGMLSFDASRGADRLSVRWLQSGSADVARFNLYRSLSDIGPFSRVNSDAVDHRVYVDEGLAALTRYYYFATAIDDSGNESASSVVYSASTNPPLMPGFPIELALPTTSSPAVGDIDGDGDNEIVVGNEYVYAWHSDGFELVDGDFDPRSWGALNTAGDEFTAAIALANIDDAAGLDIIAADLMTTSVYCMDYTGAVLPGWPQLGEDNFRATPVAGDLDGDGRVEIIAVDASGVVFAWNRNGTEVIDGDSNPVTQGVFFRSPVTTFHYQALAVCDIDLDYKDEIIIGTKSGDVFALNGDGSSVAGWPFTLPGEMVGGVVTGLIDDNVSPDIVVRSATDEVYLLNSDATVKPGWPRSIPYTEAYFRATPALADLNGDGTLEIILAQHTTVPLESKVFVLDYQGNDVSGWPVVFSDQFTESSPIVADVDGDGKLDVVIGDEEGIVHAWNRDGNALEGFPIAAQDAIRATPTIWDTDGDGDEELVLYSWDQRVYVYELAAPHDPGAGGWPAAHSNSHRNGRAGWTVATAVSDPVVRPVTRAALHQNYPNPFNPTTDIIFFVPDGDHRSVTLVVYDITGAKVRTLVDGRRPPGRFVVRWDGRDDRGISVASGVYFCRMVQQGYVATRKMIFLK